MGVREGLMWRGLRPSNSVIALIELSESDKLLSESNTIGRPKENQGNWLISKRARVYE